LPANPASAVAASGPDIRTIAIALGTRPDDRAKMVCSRGCIAYLPSTFQTGKAIPDRERAATRAAQSHCASHNNCSIFAAAQAAAIRRVIAPQARQPCSPTEEQ
jgi:hypothetical protein